jgi:hypothetical protein
MWIRIRAVIIEDEPLAAQYLAAMLDDTCQVEVIGSAIVMPVGRSVDYMSLMLFYMANSFHLARTPKLSLAAWRTLNGQRANFLIALSLVTYEYAMADLVRVPRRQ